jgi:hypothetical protein
LNSNRFNHGGRRPGAGRPKGSLLPHTQAKLRNREILRQLIETRLKEIVDAQIAHACGVSYMVLRRKDGTFTRATDAAELDRAIKQGAVAFQIFTESPSTAAANVLLAYAADRPIDPVEMEHSGGVTIKHELPE